MVEVIPAPAHLNTPGSIPLLQMLRAATAVQHKALEARLPLTRPELDVATYTQVIKAYYGFHLPLQQRLQAFDSVENADTGRLKITALVKDLLALGLTPSQIDALPQCSDLPVLENPSHLLGIQYVMEGATLGGQVLRRIIADRLSIDAASGGEFLDVYGQDTGRLWKAFLKRLADADHPDHNQDVTSAACATFASFERWLERAGVLL